MHSNSNLPNQKCLLPLDIHQWSKNVTLYMQFSGMREVFKAISIFTFPNQINLSSFHINQPKITFPNMHMQSNIIQFYPNIITNSRRRPNNCNSRKEKSNKKRKFHVFVKQLDQFWIIRWRMVTWRSPETSTSLMVVTEER